MSLFRSGVSFCRLFFFRLRVFFCVGCRARLTMCGFSVVCGGYEWVWWYIKFLFFDSVGLGKHGLVWRRLAVIRVVDGAV